MPLNMRNIKAKKVEVKGDLHHQDLLAILIHLIRKKDAKKTKVNISQRNQAKNQRVDEIHLEVTATVIVRRKIQDEGVSVVAIHIGQKRLRSPRSTKKGIRNEIEKRIKNQDTLNRLIENPRSIEDHNHLVDDNNV